MGNNANGLNAISGKFNNNNSVAPNNGIWLRTIRDTGGNVDQTLSGLTAGMPAALITTKYGARATVRKPAGDF